jgi:hypothetical protein
VITLSLDHLGDNYFYSLKKLSIYFTFSLMLRDVTKPQTIPSQPANFWQQRKREAIYGIFFNNMFKLYRIAKSIDYSKKEGMKR